MKKPLAIIAAAVMLLTIFAWMLYGFDTCGSNPEAGMKGDDLAIYFAIFVLGFMLISESTLFGGIALLISKNRTPWKVVLGIIIIIISLCFLIETVKFFFGSWLV
ncbi:MAG: hypothetical protein IKH21_05475 [Clostridia bacterium]|nr:hypothetical protein [Clostridia bacterium]